MGFGLAYFGAQDLAQFTYGQPWGPILTPSLPFAWPLHLSPVGGLRGIELQSQQPGPNHVEPVHIDHVFRISSLEAKDPGMTVTGGSEEKPMAE